MGKTLIEAIGYRLGWKAAQAKNAFDLLGGGDEESLRAEIRLGRDMEAAMLERTVLVEEDETTRFVAEIGRWLAAHIKEKKLPFRFWVTARREPHAMALPGGPVFVSWPLIELCHGERDEISFVLGHEMAHIVRRHTLDRIVKDAALSLLLRKTSGRLAAGAWLRDTGRQVLSRAFSKENEFEADAFAADLVRKSEGDARACEAFLGRLEGLSENRNPSISGGYFASHPSFRERLSALLRNGQN